jgi:hypothetical protein
MVRFLDTSNAHYQCHCDAPVELIIRLVFYRQFLELVRDLKDKRTFTNIEKNIYDALHDIPTLTELCVLILYAQAISHPYMHIVRGPDASQTNLLDLGPVHDKLKSHCQAIIANPDLLLAPDASYSTGTMDGQLWERPDAVYAVWALAPTLPHLREALVEFFEGPSDAWDCFTVEYDPEAEIAQTSASERQRAFMPTTNDVNEGGLAERRLGQRRAPNMTLEQHNSWVMYRKNNTAAFIRMCLGPADLKYLWKRVREEEASGESRKQRKLQADAYQAVSDRKRKADEVRKVNQDTKNAKIDNVELRFDTDSIRQTPGTCEQLDLELEWHRRSDKLIPKKKYVLKKQLKIATGAVITKIPRAI